MTKISAAHYKKYPDLGTITTYQSGVVQSAAFRALKKLTDDSLREHDITTMQWFIIGTIYDAGSKGIRITDLAAKLDTTLSFLTHSVNLLEAKGVLSRVTDKDDNRAKTVTVSPKFRPKCKLIESDLRRKLRTSLYATVTPEELRVYISVLRTFAGLTT